MLNIRFHKVDIDGRSARTYLNENMFRSFICSNDKEYKVKQLSIIKKKKKPFYSYVWKLVQQI